MAVDKVARDVIAQKQADAVNRPAENHTFTQYGVSTGDTWQARTARFHDPWGEEVQDG